MSEWWGGVGRVRWAYMSTGWAILAFDMSDEEKEGVQVTLHNEAEIYGNT